jgi:hypothetical protein
MIAAMEIPFADCESCNLISLHMQLEGKGVSRELDTECLPSTQSL